MNEHYLQKHSETDIPWEIWPDMVKPWLRK